jgi:crossover junction endodeoxyribonuclease RuvC
MKILGVDPGYERLGIAILEKKGGKEEVIYSECFHTDKKSVFPERLVMIGDKIEKVIKIYKPEMLAIETLFLNTNQKTAMKVSESRGVVIYKAKKLGLEIFEGSPPQIKMATTGHGGADKEQVKKMVKMLVKIDESKKSDDELDAIAIALTAFANIR